MLKLKVSVPLLAAVLFTAACSNSPSASKSSTPAGGNPPVPAVIVYVSALGSDTNSGLSASFPLLTIQTAVDLAKASNYTVLHISGNVLLTNTNSNGCGLLLEGVTNLAVSGGWNSGFTAQGSESVLDGGQIANTVVVILSCKQITLSNLQITGGTNGNNGGGISLFNSDGNSVCCKVLNNIAMAGGGIFLINSHNNSIGGTISSNYAASGGGLFIEDSASNKISADFYYNKSDEFGGAVETSGIYYTVFSGRMTGNSGGTGGGIDLYNASFCEVGGIIASNSAGKGGGLSEDEDNSGYGSNIISATITGNNASQGGGVYIALPSPYEKYTGIITGNSATNEGGGMYISGANSYTISAQVLSNTAVSGGGIYLSGSTSNTISGIVSGNLASGSGGGISLPKAKPGIPSIGMGGGIYLSDSTSNTISGIVSGNSASGSGGGLYLAGDCDVISGSVTGNTSVYDGGGVYIGGAVSNTFTSSCIIRYNRCNVGDGGGLGGGVYLDSGSDNTFETGAITTPNYTGSTGTTIDDLYGITRSMLMKGASISFSQSLTENSYQSRAAASLKAQSVSVRKIHKSRTSR